MRLSLFNYPKDTLQYIFPFFLNKSINITMDGNYHITIFTSQQILFYSPADWESLETSQDPITHHHHRVLPLVRTSLALSRNFSLSFIASDRSSGLHPLSSHSCCMYVRDGRPAFDRPYVGVHRSTSLMSSSLLHQQCPGSSSLDNFRIVSALLGVAAMSCSILLATFLCNCRLASSPAV